MSDELQINYRASETLQRFHNSTAFVRGIRGPIGSGKSVGCCFEIFIRMAQQEPGTDGKRRSRWAVIRNTYPELETTTIKTWLDWFPEGDFGKLSRKVPICHHFQYQDIEAEVYFIALNRPDDVKKLLSLELTGIFFNEVREIPLENVLMGCDRVGRYPSQKSRPEHIARDKWPTWYGVIMDTNPPEEDHWWAIFAGDSPPPEDWEDWEIPNNWEIFTQPPAAFEMREKGKLVWGLNPRAENLENLPKNYYHNLIQGKPPSHVRVYVGNKYGVLNNGKLVYPEYSDDMHRSDIPLKAMPGRTIHVGLDFGQTPAASFGQLQSNGQWWDIHELVTENMGGKRFAQLLKREVSIMFPEHRNNIEFWGDPSGAYTQGGEDASYFQILKSEGIDVKPAPTQNPTTRLEAGREPLERVVSGGLPGYKISPLCKFLIKGFKSGYARPRVNTPGVIRYLDKPEKNKYSHVHEARQYALCGAGYGKEITKRPGWLKRNTPANAKMDFDVFK